MFALALALTASGMFFGLVVWSAGHPLGALVAMQGGSLLFLIVLFASWTHWVETITRIAELRRRREYFRSLSACRGDAPSDPADDAIFGGYKDKPSRP